MKYKDIRQPSRITEIISNEDNSEGSVTQGNKILEPTIEKRVSADSYFRSIDQYSSNQFEDTPIVGTTPINNEPSFSNQVNKVTKQNDQTPNFKDREVSDINYLMIKSFKLKEDLDIRHGTQKLFLMIQLGHDHFASKPFTLTNDLISFESHYMINN